MLSVCVIIVTIVFVFNVHKTRTFFGLIRRGSPMKSHCYSPHHFILKFTTMTSFAGLFSLLITLGDADEMSSLIQTNLESLGHPR